MKRIAMAVAVLLVGVGQVSAAQKSAESSYNAALELLQLFDGFGTEADQAKKIADELAISAPKSGYAQTLAAEWVSIWQLDHAGGPLWMREELFRVAQEAVRLNPKLAQPHVAIARGYLRSGDLDQAQKEVGEALRISPQLPGAAYMQAAIYKERFSINEAEKWFQRFVSMSKNPRVQSNGYAALAELYIKAISGFDPVDQRSDVVALAKKARLAYQKAVDLDPAGLAKRISFAAFLNDEGEDFEAAELNAEKALKIKPSEWATYQRAFAQYQKLLRITEEMDSKETSAAVDAVEASTNVSIDEAVRASVDWTRAHSRIEELQLRTVEPIVEKKWWEKPAGLVAEKFPPNYLRALDLIHEYEGSGNELKEAEAFIESLRTTYPESGYAQALTAELASVWRLDSRGGPFRLRHEILQKANEAIKLNPNLAQPYVAKARAYRAAGELGTAITAIEKANFIDPELPGAIFLTAALAYEAEKSADRAEAGYLKFVSKMENPKRKKNGYHALIGVYQGVLFGINPDERKADYLAAVAKTRTAYQKMVDLDPSNEHSRLDFARFLNNYAWDFDAAELQARKAFELEDSSDARYQLAFAQYQKISKLPDSTSSKAVSEAIGKVIADTGISLLEAVARCEHCYYFINKNLEKLQLRTVKQPPASEH